MAMKLAVTGKGGVGKTTLSALLARLFARQGHPVLAVDADPNPNLGGALGLPAASQPTPLVEMKALIEERMGTGPDGVGSYFTLNPKVDDLPERFWVPADGVRLLVMGGIDRGGGGCACAANSFLRALMQHLLLERDQIVILDMEAGVEHLGRGTAEAVDSMVVVAEPSLRSTQTAHRMRALAGQIGLTRLYAVGNRVSSDSDRQFLEAEVAPLELLGALPFSRRLAESERSGDFWENPDPSVVSAVEEIAKALEARIASQVA